jgi:hypothetical protein
VVIAGGTKMLEVSPLFLRAAKAQGFGSRNLVAEAVKNGSVQDSLLDFKSPDFISKIFDALGAPFICSGPWVTYAHKFANRYLEVICKKR